MARRIALVVIALVAVLLGVAAIPLGVLTSNQDQRDFRTDTVAAATTVSSVAEEFLGDHADGVQLAKSIAGLKRRGDIVAVYAADGRQVAGTRAVPGTSRRRSRLAPGPSRRPRMYSAAREPDRRRSGHERCAARLARQRGAGQVDRAARSPADRAAWLARRGFGGRAARRGSDRDRARALGEPCRLAHSRRPRSTSATATSPPARQRRRVRARCAGWPPTSTGWLAGLKPWSAATRR